jgi:hypothetical protein
MIPGPTGVSARSHQQWEAYLADRVQASARDRALVEELVSCGYTPAEAQAMVSRAVGARHGRLAGTLGCSLLLFLAGVATLITPLQSQNRAWLWIGAIICGLTGIVYCLLQFAKTR